MGHAAAKRKFFPLVLWGAAAVAVIYLTIWPVVASWWAKGHWDQVPSVAMEGEAYAYTYKGRWYVGHRHTFWSHQAIRSDSTPVEKDMTSSTSICYVNPNAPEYAVLTVDALGHLKDGTKGFFVAGMVVLVATAMTVSTRRMPKNS